MGRPSAQAPVPLPDRLPGPYCLVEYDRDGQTYSLYTFGDRVNPIRYDLGEDNPKMRLRIAKYLPKFPDAMPESIDVARDFSAAQVIFKDGRVIAQRKPQERVVIPGDPASARMAFINERELDHGFPAPIDPRRL